MSGVWRRAGSFLPARRLTFVVLLLAAVAFGGVFAVAQAQEAEGAINGLTLSSDTPGTLTVSWDTPSPAPSDYRLRWAPAESAYPSWKDDNETDRGNEYPAGDATSLTLSGLSQGVEFKVQVRARYNDGDAPWSGSWASSSLRVSGDAQEEEATPTPEPTATPDPTPVPGAINGLTLGSETPGTLTVSWDAPSPQPTDYRLRWAPVGSDYLPWSDDDETDRGNAYPGGGDTSLTLSGLSEETEFKVQVRARYNDGAHKDKPWSGPWTEEVRGQPSEESAGSGVKGATDDPSAPAGPNIVGTAVTPEGQVLLAWLNPSDDSITGYQVLRGPDADNLVVIEEDTGSSGTSYTDTSPPAGRTHTYAVKARNAAGLSPPSNTVTAAVPEAEEEEEELITAQQNSDAILVSNLGQPSAPIGEVAQNQESAQAFVAGPGLAGFGYRFEGIRVSIARDTFLFPSMIPQARASLHGDAGGLPGALLHTLTLPDDFASTGAFTDYTLSAPPGTVLPGGDKYWVVLEVLSAALTHGSTTSADEDQAPPPVDGWFIDNERYGRSSGGAWQSRAGVVKLAVLGEPEWDTSEPASEPADGDLPADTTTRGILVVDGAGVTGTHFSYDDVDWYVVELEADTDYEFRGVNTTPHSRLHVLKVHNHEGEEQSSSLIEFNTSRGQYEHVERLNKLPYNTSTAGTYYVSIEPWNYGSGAEKVYTLTARSDDSPDCRTGERPAGESFRLCATGTDPVDHPGVTLDPARMLPIAISVGDIAISARAEAESYIMRTRPDSTSSNTDDADMFRVLLNKNNLYRFEWDVACVHEGIILGIIDDNHDPQVSETSVSRIHNTCDNVIVEFTPTVTTFYNVIVSARGSQFPVSGLDRSPRARYPFLGVRGTLTVVDTTAPPPNSPAKGDPLARGERKVGANLAADIGGITDADGLTDPMFTYQWQRDDGGTPADISGATSDTYTLTDDDVGKRIRLQVQFTDDDDNQETRTGPATSLVVPAPHILVGNLSQRPSVGATYDVSTAFITGTHPLGYALDSVHMSRNPNTAGSNSLAEFRLYDSYSGSNLDLLKPAGTRLVTASGPDNVSGEVLTFLPPNVKLDPATTYHVVLTGSQGPSIGCRSGSNSLDSGSLAGFNIANHVWNYPAASFQGLRGCAFRLYGFEMVSSKFVEKVEFTSSPAQVGMYATGEVIEATATLSEAVTFDGPPPELPLQVGDEERQMTYVESASTPTSWVFRYTVVAGDRDDNGVSIERNALQGYADAGLSHNHLKDQSDHNVNAAPRIVSRQVSSRPVAPNWYGPGEQIQFTVGFSLPVTVVGDPELEFNVTTPGPQSEFATYVRGSGTTELVFSYTVGAGDDDPDGIFLGPDSLRLDSDDAITSVYNGLDAALDHSALGTRSSHRIDQNPRAVSQEVTSNPTRGANSDTYGAGDAITFEVVFNQMVTVTGGPRLRFNIGSGSGAEYASYVSGSGTDTLVFSYTVLAADADTDGIYLFNEPLDYPATDSIVGTANSLPAENQGIGRTGALSGHKVDGSITSGLRAVEVQFGAASYTATEGGSAVTVTVTLSADPERTVTAPLEVTAGGGATAGDYTLSADSVTFNAGDTSATFTVTAADDTDDDDGESITIGFGTLPDGVTAASPDSTTVSLVDNDNPAVTVRFDQASYTATEGRSAVTVTVALSADPERTVTAPLEVTVGGGATAGDYTLSADSVTFDAGDTSATFTVTAPDDTDNDDGESITIGFGTLPDGVTAASPDSTTVSLVDDDFPAVTVRFLLPSFTATEGGSEVTVPVELSADPERTVTVDLEVTAGGGATASDYTLSADSVTFHAGDTFAEFTVTAADDTDNDDGESITIGFGTLPDGVTAASPDSTTVSLLDDDFPAVTVRFDQASYTATEGGSAVTVTVTLSADPEGTVTAPLEVTAGGGATASDYTLSADWVTFDAGDTSATFTVTAADDTDDDDGESITIGFGTLPDGVTAASPDSTTVSLVDNDNPAVTVRFDQASYTATEGGSAVTVTVALSADPERTVTAPLEVTVGGGATAGDYTLSADSVTFDAGDTSATFTVTAADDTDNDDGESITIGFGTLPDGVTAASPDSTTVSLVDDDFPAVTVRFLLPSFTATEGGSEVTVPVELSADPERTVTVDLEVTAGGGATAGDYTLSADSVTFHAGDTIADFTVTAADDTDNDDGESITIGFGTLPDGVTAASPDSTTVSLLDDDFPAVTVRFDQASYTATEGGSAVTVTVVLSADPEGTVTAPLEVTAGGGATASDYTLSSDWVTFDAGDTSATFTVTAADDTDDDDGESITIGFGTLPDGVTAASPDSTTVSLLDDDFPAVRVQFDQFLHTAVEGSTVTVTVSLSADPERTVTVDLVEIHVNDATTADYTLSATSVTFAAGETTAEFTVTAVDDDIDDDGEELLFGFATPLPDGVTAGLVPHAAVELVDNDNPAVTVRFDQASYTATEGGTAATVTVVLSADPERTVTAPLEVTAGGGATAGDYTLSADSVTFHAGDTFAEFTVTAADDTDTDAGESITIGFGTLPDRVTAASPDSTTVSLVDNDNSPTQGDPLPRGEREVGATLTGDTSGITDADGLPDAMFAYQWQRVDGGAPADISGETSDTYTLTDEDVGKRIRLQVRFTDDGGTPETLTGPATSLVVPEPRILVGNLSQSQPASIPSDASTGFVTGTHPLGYAIESIEMTRNDTTLVSSAFGEFRLYASTVNSDPLDRKPDRASRLVTVSGPDGVSGSVLTFGALSRVKLDPGATYHAVLTRSQGGAIGCSQALSGLDSGSLAGFSIIPRSWNYPGANGYSAGCRLRIRGFELVSSSFVEKVEFTSSPAQAGMYATGEAIEATVTLNEAVTFEDPPPVLLLQIGANVREMTYVASASTATSWVFRYTVAAGDRDDDGVSIERNALRGYADADLSHRGIDNDRERHVNAAPRVVSRGVTSRPVAPNWYGPGEQIQFTVEFSLPVTVVGDPQLEFNVTTPGPQSEFASYVRGSGTTELVFSYTVGAGDDDPDGIFLGPDSLRLDSDDAITSVYNGLDAVLDHSRAGALTRHKIDQNPRVVSQKVISDPAQGTNSDTYGAGDAITFEVVFNQAVIVTGDPQLRFNVSGPGGAEYADYTGGSGTNTLEFSYTVLATETDTDGIYLFGDPLTLEIGESILGADNSLPAVNEISGADRAVGGHKIDGSITGGLRAVEVQFGAASYTATEGGTAATVTVTLSTDPERTVTAPLEVTAGGGATAGDYTLSADSVTFDAGDTSATFTVTAADDADSDDGESITIGFGTLPDRVTAASPDSTTVSLVDNDDSPAQGDPLPRGEREVGATLTADIGGITDADGLTDPMFTYQWQRVDGGTPADISGATSDTYTLTVDDVGKRIQLQVRFTDDGGTPETLTGPATSLVVPEPRILVGNLSQSQPASIPSDASTGFVTGTHPLGYAIESIQMARNSTTFVSSAFGEFRLYASTVNSNPLDRKPDRASRLVTVSGPDSVSGKVLTFAPSRVKLDPGATYHAVLTRSAGGAIGCNLAGSGLDSGSLAGFSIIPQSWDYPRAKGTSPDCRLRIRGFELVSSSFVEKVEFTSSPALAGMYATGEVIEATATLSEAVTFAEPSPVLLLQIGANEREMTYVASASTATSWVFRYTVAADDRDDDGVSIERNALRGYADADLSHRGIDNDRERHVNAAPRVVSRQVSSRPVAPNWYGPGEHIEFTVEFSLPVTVFGDPQLEFNVTTPGPQSEFASYVRGSGTTELVFSYTVGAGDDDDDGIFWSSNSLRLDSDDVISSVYNSLDAVLDHSALGTRSRHRIDQNPRVVSQKVTSDPTHGANSDTYGAGDAITFEVVFNQTVTVTGGPRLRFNVSGPGGSEYADYTGGSGTNTLEFFYTVLATETDTDGIYLFGDPLTLETGESILGADNSLPAVNEISGADRAVGGHKIDGSITSGLRAVTVRFDQASYTATEGGTAVTVTVALSADPERTVTAPLEVTAGGGATAGDYTLSADSVTFDAGDTSATFTVTAADDTDNDDGESITIGFGTLPDRVIAASPDSTTVSLVDNDNSPAQGDPLPRGEREVGATLTADTSGITDADGLTDPMFTYQWQRVDGGAPADISGETSDTYTLMDDDVGKRIRLQVQFIDDDNYPETRTGPATSLIVREPRLLVGNLSHTASPTFTRSNVSTGFVTGAHPLGYTIDEFRIQRYSGTTVSSGLAEFRLHTSTSRSDPLDRLPGARIITVSGPDNVSGGVLTFDMPSKVKLSPGATYHVALTTSTGEHIGCFTAPDGEDSGSLAGFDIIDRNYGYPDPSTVFFPDKSCRFQINGFELMSSSFVEKVEFTSTPALAGMYATGEVMEVTATLSEAVAFVGPPPVLLLQIGDNQREMTYEASASTATSWVFRYTVAAGDRDDDGVPLERNALRGYADADLSHRGIDNDRERHVNAAPRIVSRQVSSRPVAPNWYGPGEHIEFTVEFSLPVTVVGDPQLEFNVTTPGPQSEFASYLRGSGTTELVFSYTVGAGDDDPDGIWSGADSLRLDGDDSITGVYNGLDAVLDHSALGTRSRHRIDQNPRVVSQKVTSDPTHGANSDTYGAGDAITFEVVFNQAVTVTGDPRLRFNIGSGSGAEYASYVSGSGTDTLVFSYTVLAADADTDGIYLFNDPLDYPDAATDSIVGEDNSLPAVNAISGADRAVEGHKIDGSITN